METVWKEHGTLGRIIEVKVANEEFSQKWQKEVQGLAKTSKLPGFRAGKIPERVIIERYGQEIRRNLLNGYAQQALEMELAKKPLNLVGYPKVEVKGKQAAGEDLCFTVEFEIEPEVILPELGAIEVTKEVMEVTDDLVEDRVNEYCKEHLSTWKTATKEYLAAKGDRLIIDFVITVGGRVITKNENAKVILGDGKTWEGFEENLYNLKINAEKEFTLDIPTTHLDKNLAGKKCHFKVIVKDLAVRDTPELTDSLLRDRLGFKDLNSMKGHFYKNLIVELPRQAEAKVAKKILFQLGEKVNFELPPGLLDHRCSQLSQQMKGLTKEVIREEAIKQLKREFLVRALILKGKIKVEQEEVKSEILKVLSVVSQDQKEVSKKMESLFKDEKVIGQVTERIFENKLIQYLVKEVKIVEKIINYEGKNVGK